MKLSAYLAPARVAVTAAQSKDEALDAALALFQGSPAVQDHALFAEAIRQREDVLPTGIGLGIGVPHVRSRAVRLPAAALLALRAGVDYGSLDGAPVRIVLMVAMPENTQNDYLMYLARASRLFQDAAFRESLLACATAEELWEAVKDK